MSVLTPAHNAAFWEQGYLTIPGAVSENRLAELRRVFAGWVDESRKHTRAFGRMKDGRPRFDVEPGHCAERPALRRVAAPTELSRAFLEVLIEGPMIEMVADLIGPDLRFHHSKLNSKLPGAATAVKWHQDFAFDPHSNDDMVTALVFMDDVSSSNGPLMVAPGTHRGPIYSLWQSNVFTGAVAEEVAADLDRYALEQTGPAGSVCLMHVRLAHASGANRGQHPRTLYISCIAAADAMPLVANAVPSVHEGMLLKGSEPGRVRCERFELAAPELPAGASFFEQQALQ